MMFRVSWVDDRGEVQVNRGYRIQHSSAIGPYKGGLRFHPSVNLSILKVPRLRADLQERADHAAHGRRQGRLRLRSQGPQPATKSCASARLSDHRTVPPRGAGHRRAGGRHRRRRPRSRLHGRHDEEAQQQRRLRVHRQGPVLRRLADPSRSHRLRHGLLRQEMLRTKGMSLSRACACRCRARATWRSTPSRRPWRSAPRSSPCSDSERHRDRRSRLHAREAGADGHQEPPVRPRFRLRPEVRPQVRAGKRPWGVPVDIALPCATQNEVDGNDARELVKNGVKCVAEGANMPSDLDAVHIFLDAKILYGPGKAANAGGVATSGLEMTRTLACACTGRARRSTPACTAS
jgi:glutamate dehydrogenase (NADP+)